MSRGYNLGRTRIFLSRQRLVLQTKKWVATVFKGSRDTISVAIYFSFKKQLSQQEKQGHNIIFQ